VTRVRCRARFLATLGLGLYAGAAIAGEDYASLPDYKAAAVYTLNPDQPYVVEGAANKLAAATAAQRACVAANPTQSAEAFCELTRVGNETLTSAAEIRARLPTNPHPLFLWRYQRGHATVYLAGSVHVLKLGLHPLPVQFQHAFDLSDYLVLEVNLSAFTPAQLQFKSMEHAMLPQNQQLADLLPEATYRDLDAIAASYGLPLAQMARFKPSFVTQQLGVLALLSAGYDPNHGVETYFTDQAAEKSILQLETLDFQLDLLMNQSIDTQVSMVQDTLASIGDFEPFTASLVTAWLAGDDEAFQRAFDAQAGASAQAKAFMRKVMDERNINMATKIAELLQGDGHYFVLVGAAHYIGQNSIINLLDERGLRGRRIYSNHSLSQ